MARGLWPARAPEPAVLRPQRVGGVEISVVVPLYNHAAYVDAALRSALTQTAPPFDVVVIDDGSTDAGVQVARAALHGSRNTRVLSQDNCGAHVALNRAIGLCRGRYIAVLNSDDIFLPRKLEYVQALLATDPALDLIAGGVELIDSGGGVLTKGPAVDWLKRAHAFASDSGLPRVALLNENFVATTSNMVFSRRLWEAIGGFAPLRYCHDLDFLMRAYESGRVKLDSERPHIRYRVHARNTIGEDLASVRVELAAVVAATLRDAGPALLDGGGDDAGFAAFQTFLANKQISDLTLYFMTLRDRFASRGEFYAHVTAEPQRSRYAEFLRGRGA
jgi:glycosyltransferase involved in cell wall biosynthesis